MTAITKWIGVFPTSRCDATSLPGEVDYHAPPPPLRFKKDLDVAGEKLSDVVLIGIFSRWPSTALRKGKFP